MIISYAKIEGTKVLGFFEADDEGPNDVDFAHQATAAPVTSWPATDSPTKELHIDAAGELYWVETATLAQLKEYKTAEITSQRLAADSDHFVYQGHAIRTADKDMFDLLIANARIMMSAPQMPTNWPGGWKDINNSYLIISTVDQWKAFFIAMYDTGIVNFMYSQQLKAMIFAAQTPEAVAAINWNSQP